MMLGLDAGKFTQGFGDGEAMTGFVVALVAQQRNGAREFFGQLFEQLALLVEVFAELLEKARVVAVFAQLMADIFR